LEIQLLFEFGLLGNCKSLPFMDLEPELPFLGGSGSREKGRHRAAPAPEKKGGTVRLRLRNTVKKHKVLSLNFKKNVQHQVLIQCFGTHCFSTYIAYKYR